MKVRSSLTARMVMLGAALAVVVGVAIGVLLLAVADMRHAARMARHSAQVLAAANLAEKELLDTETGARGFALTRDERFLAPWRSARAALPRRVDALSTLVADNPSQEARVQRIAEGLRGYIDEYSIPEVDAIRRRDNPPPAADGKRRVDAIRAEFARFDASEQRLADTRRDNSDRAAARAMTVGVIVLVLGVALMLAFAAYLGRSVAGPVRRVAGAADKLAAGDLGARVRVGGRDELALLATSFNTMGDALQDQRDELDSQHAELEQQTAELADQQAQLSSANDELRAQRDELEQQTAALEDQQAQLSGANDELRAQRDELERLTASLADETERQLVFGEFAEALAAHAALEARARTSLRTLAATEGALVGALYAADDAEAAGGYELLATLGLERAQLPERIGTGSGLAGRALAERRLVQAGHEGATLTVRTIAGEMPVRHEFHVPLLYGERTIGVVSLGRTVAGGLDARGRDRLDHLADQAAVALVNAFVTKRAQRLGDINRAVLDTVRDGIFFANADGIVLANAPAQRMSQEILGVPLEEALTLDPTQVAARTTDAAGYLAANELIAADPDEPTFDEVELAGSGRVFERYTAPVRGADGERLGRTTVIRDVTPEREAERAKNELMATVSHELRTPLASIIGFTELLLLRDPERDVRMAHLQTVDGEARRLAELIDDFLDLQRIGERGRLPLERRRVDLRPLVSDQARVFAAQSEAHSLAVRMPDEALVTEADPSRLKQVLANLLSNAIKYSPDGGEIAVEGWAREGVVGVAVSDPGVGIPTAQQERVFERFYRAPSATERAIGGTGLGLALSREIVEAHDGAMGFESVEGRGSRFWFELPAAADGSTGSNGSSS